nr:probable serine/threonine-protein kinase PIX13 [Tanacetum cinerariifolium]
MNLMMLLSLERAEIEMLSEFRHSYNVSLLGYSGNREMILVYKYMSNGSLYDHLHKNISNGSNSSLLTWVQMLNICVGAARGLDYLHTVIGTFGYMDAEYFLTHRLTLRIISDSKILRQSNGNKRKDIMMEKQATTLAEIGCHSGVVLQLSLNRIRSLERVVLWQDHLTASLWTAHMEELILLGKLSHPDLGKLFGYCWEVVLNNEEPKTKPFMKFTYTELRSTTRNFRQDKVIGEGGFGKVYKGWLDSVTYNPWGADEGAEPLPMYTRIKIATGAAQGLAFLLISENNVIYYNAKLSDFGLAKLGPHNGESHVTTRVVGTYGFMAPEYIATGLRAMVTKRYGRDQNLLDWGRPILSGKKSLQKIMDPRLVGDYPTKAASKIAKLILICLRIDPKQRSSMDEVVSELQFINEINMKPRRSKAKTRQSSDWHQQNHCWSPFGTKQETEA